MSINQTQPENRVIEQLAKLQACVEEFVLKLAGEFRHSKERLIFLINNYDLIEDELVVCAGWVDEGPAIKRMLPRARGSANMIKKRTSHITIVVGEQNGK